MITERDYILLTDLTKVRIAEHIMRDITASDEEFHLELQGIILSLRKMRQNLESKVKVQS